MYTEQQNKILKAISKVFCAFEASTGRPTHEKKIRSNDPKINAFLWKRDSQYSWDVALNDYTTTKDSRPHYHQNHRLLFLQFDKLQETGSWKKGC